MDLQEQKRVRQEWTTLLRRIQGVIDRLDPLDIFIDEESKVLTAGEYEDIGMTLLRDLRGCRSEGDALEKLKTRIEQFYGAPAPERVPAQTVAAREIWRLFEASPIRPLLSDPQVAPGGPLG